MMKKEKFNFELLDLLWLRAAVLGSIWASSEIILGSFLHNLRIPFSGTFLSAIGVYMLVAFDVKWKHNGVLIRAGIICALMKSISPSAFIFGPMIAITAEALLLSLTVRLFGRNFLGYGIGGALAVTWSLVHKILNMIILYGTDIIKIYENLYSYASKVTSLNMGSPADLITILFASYLCIGFIVSSLGMIAGKNAVHTILDVTDSNKIQLAANKPAVYNKHKVLWLFIQIIVLVAGLVILNTLPFYLGLLFTLVVSIINVFRYGDFLIRRFKLKFWIELALITTIAGCLMNGIKSTGWEFSYSNLLNGFQITLRALLLTQCFTLISIELANPYIKDFFLKLKLGKLPIALEAAFSALPLMLAVLSSHKDKFRNPSILISGYITLADNWIAELSVRNGNE